MPAAAAAETRPRLAERVNKGSDCYCIHGLWMKAKKLQLLELISNDLILVWVELFCRFGQIF